MFHGNCSSPITVHSLFMSEDQDFWLFSQDYDWHYLTGKNKKISEGGVDFFLLSDCCVLGHCVIFISRRNLLSKERNAVLCSTGILWAPRNQKGNWHVRQITSMEVLRVTEQEGTRNSALLRNSIPLMGKQSKRSQVTLKGSWIRLLNWLKQITNCYIYSRKAHVV